MLYADHAATTPLAPPALELIHTILRDTYGNPSGLHSESKRASKLLSRSRIKLAELMGARPAELTFTSGATESNNQAIRGLTRGRGGVLVTTSVEHSAILGPCRDLERRGRLPLVYLGYESMGCGLDGQTADGKLDVAFLKDRIPTNVALVSVIAANNEVGTLQDLEGLAEVAHSKGALFHTDATQWVGKLPLNLRDSGIDALSLSAHKFGGPKGVGALFLRHGVSIEPLLYGGGQERGLRSGTQNVAGACAMAAALEWTLEQRATHLQSLNELTKQLIERLSRVPGALLTGHPVERIPGHASFVFEGVEGLDLVAMLDRAGIAASTGSACSSHTLTPSHVLKALNIPDSHIHGSLRLTLGWHTTQEEIDTIVTETERILRLLRAQEVCTTRSR